MQKCKIENSTGSVCRKIGELTQKVGGKSKTPEFQALPALTTCVDCMIKVPHSRLLFHLEDRGGFQAFETPCPNTSAAAATRSLLEEEVLENCRLPIEHQLFTGKQLRYLHHEHPVLQT